VYMAAISSDSDLSENEWDLVPRVNLNSSSYSGGGGGGGGHALARSFKTRAPCGPVDLPAINGEASAIKFDVPRLDPPRKKELKPSRVKYTRDGKVIPAEYSKDRDDGDQQKKQELQAARISNARISVPRLSTPDLGNRGQARPGMGVTRMSVAQFQQDIRMSQPRASWVQTSATHSLVARAHKELEKEGKEIWRVLPRFRPSVAPTFHPRKPQNSRTYVTSPYGELFATRVKVEHEVANVEAPPPLPFRRDRRASMFRRTMEMDAEDVLPIFTVTPEVLRKLGASARRGQMSDLKGMLERGCDVNAQDSFGNTAIIWGAQNGHAAVCRLCLEHGAEVNHQNKKGNSALHFAITYAFSDVADALLEAGADPSMQNLNGKTPYEGL